MYLESLTLIQYRNYEYQEALFHPSLNIFLGANAQGKTNFLESIYVSARGRSYKNVSDRDLILFGERSAYIKAVIDRQAIEKVVEVKLSQVEPKRIRINEIEIENLKELTYQFDVVLFAPEDLELIKGGPGLRRSFLDELLTGVEPSYRKRRVEYDRLLEERNFLLKRRPDTYFAEQLAVYDRQLAQSAYGIIRRRSRISQRLAQLMEPIGMQLSDQTEFLGVDYQTNVLSADQLALLEERDLFIKHFLDLLAADRSRDLKRMNTLRGPHRDELLLSINDLVCRPYASQGQARSVAIALKLAELKILEQANHDAPILLLDDVFSELDHKRAHYLLEAIGPYQTMITSNSLNKEVLQDLPARVFEVVNGQLYCLDPDEVSEEERKNGDK